MSGQSTDEKTREFEGNDLDSPSSNKRMKEMSIDRLSELPDGILIHILSFLGVKKSAVTSVLSKRWEFIWTELPRLHFYESSEETDNIRQFVAKVLLIRSTSRLEEFSVCFRYNDNFESDVDSWVDFVLKHKVKVVGLLLLTQKKDEEEEEEEEEELYALHETMYSNSSLTRFSVKGCDLDTLTKIEWPSLTRLDIENSELTQHVVDNILSGCPLLHTLDLKECSGFNCLDIKSQNLLKLKVHDREDGENGPLLEISAPYVHTLDISFDSDRRKLVLRNIQSLVRAEINFIKYWPPGEEITSITMELFEITLHVKELHLGRQYFQVLSELVVNGWQLPISRRKCLIVNSFTEDKHNISGIFALLKSSPNLEMFVIDGFEGETLGEVAVGDLNRDFLHMKTVEKGDFGGEPMLKVAQTLLKRATILDESSRARHDSTSSVDVREDEDGPLVGWSRFFKEIDDMREENRALKASVRRKYDSHRAMSRAETKKARALFPIDLNLGVVMKVEDDDEGNNVDEKINWYAEEFWMDIRWRDYCDFESYTASKIKDDALFYAYKLIEHVVFSKDEVSKIPELERQLLWCLVNKTTPCLLPLLLGMTRHHINESKALLSFGPLIGAIAGIDPGKLGCTNIGVLYVPTRTREKQLVVRARAAHVGESSRARHDLTPSVDVPEDEDGLLVGWSLFFKAIDNMREENRALHASTHAMLDSQRAMSRAEYKKVRAKYKKALAEYKKIRAEYKEAGAEHKNTQTIYKKLRAEYDEKQRMRFEMTETRFPIDPNPGVAKVDEDDEGNDVVEKFKRWDAEFKRWDAEFKRQEAIFEKLEARFPIDPKTGVAMELDDEDDDDDDEGNDMDK